MDAHPQTDRRVTRTREAIRTAFFALVTRERYDRISLKRIIEDAGVGRSTFYAHYRNKEDLLLDSLDPLLTPLADAACRKCDRATLDRVLGHLWDRRALGRVLFSSPTDRMIAERLGALIADRLAERAEDKRMATSTAEAAGIVAVLARWYTGRLSMEVSALADWLESRTASPGPR